jgi:oxygen-independent coproporphyrinogen-3 oxidase
MDAYVDRLCAEIAATRETAERLGAHVGSEADSIYFGGGTPSLLQREHFRTIFAVIRDVYRVVPSAEATIECAPGQLSDATLEELLQQGVNRISLGVQSFIDREASAVGRLHTGEQCEQEIARLQREGVEDIGLDLIAGLPHQTEASWRESLQRTIESGVKHVSLYMLEVDEDSRLGREVIGGGARYGAQAVPDEDLSAALYEIGCEVLATAGIGQYEISNFAREGHRSRHNMKYWRRQPYLGMGLDAHSMLHTGTGAVRFQNTDDLDVYMQQQGPLRLLPEKAAEDAELVDKDAAFEETLFLGLRMNDGVRMESVRLEFGETLVAGVMPAIDDACEAGLLVMDEDYLRLTSRGRMASNEVFSRLLITATV